MKQHWQRMALKIDALTLRERAIIFAMVALILVTLVNSVLLDPQFAKQKQLSERIRKDQSMIAGMQAQIQQKASAQTADPDRDNKARLEDLKQQGVRMQAELRDLESGLVPPDRMSALLEEILKKHNALRLVSLKTLSSSPLMEASNVQDKPANGVVAPARDKAQLQPAVKPEAAAADTVYKHGVEIVVQGGYLDILDYLAQLEAMPSRLVWSAAKLSVDEYPKCTLTLTLFTLSLDKKWLNL
jgi:MSHA biogenesis protein MshJ